MSWRSDDPRNNEPQRRRKFFADSFYNVCEDKGGRELGLFMQPYYFYVLNTKLGREEWETSLGRRKKLGVPGAVCLYYGV